MLDRLFGMEIARNWELPEPIREDDLVSDLAERVEWLMKHDYERLLNAIYLLDVPERRFHEAVRSRPTGAAARRLAEAILERERQKFESRRRYRRERSLDVPAEEVDDGGD